MTFPLVQKWRIIAVTNAKRTTTPFCRVNHPVPTVVQELQDSNQHRRVEVGQIKMPKTASIQTRLDIIHKLEMEEQPSLA